MNVESAARRQAREFAERSIRRLALHLGKLEAAKIRPIIIGGWAVTAHGSPLGSRDIDALIRMGDQRAAGDALGNADFVARHLDGDSMFDYDFYEATNHSRVDLPYKFDYKRVLDRRIQTRPLTYPGGSVKVRVPDPTSLFFLKLKAFTDRSYSYWLRTHPEELRHLEEDTKKFLLAESAEYWAAKAAKDMEDLAFLSTLTINRKRVQELLGDSGLRRFAVREWTRRLPVLLEVADRIRAEAALEAGFVKAQYEKVLDLIA